MSSTSGLVQPPRRCPQCSAPLDEAARKCWLCAAEPLVPPAAESTFTTVGPSLAEPEVNPWLTHGAIWLAILVAAVVGYGVLVENMIVGLGYVIAVVPPLLITSLASSLSRAADRPIHPAAKLALGAGIAAISLPLAAAIMLLALIVGLFQICTTGKSPLLDFLGQ